ncbi:MAG: VWA domain-containing protein [Proteobacteria bacterium]|jgi:Ca-activated chloride channel family protein|nr:VWA domain-containing protein [Pseudomonadota bacterium]
MSALSGFVFAHPWVLFLLLVIPLLAWLKGKFGGTAGVTFSNTSMLAKIGNRRRSRAGAFLAALTYLALALFIVALARPQFGRVTTRVQATGVDIMLVLDVSRSMLAEDFTIGNRRANRIDAVKLVTEQFIRERPNDRIGLVAFAGRPYLVSPLTLDHDWLIRNLERLRIGLVEDGTAIGSAIASAANRLKDKEAKTKLIVLLTDGDNNAGKVQPLTAAEAAKALGIRIYTIGAGTEGEAPFPLTNQFGRTVYRNVLVKFDEKTLQEIATMTSGQYFRATDTNSLRTIFGEIDKLEKSKVEVEKTAQYRDLFMWFLIPGLACLALEILLSQTVWRRLP